MPPVALKYQRCKMTEAGPMMKTPAMMTDRISVRESTAIATMTPPMAIEPTSPMKTFAFGAFHQRKPTSAPTNDAAMIVRSIGSRVS